MKELAAALVKAQGEMPAVKADARNPHFNSEFVSLDHLIAQTRPVLAKHDLAIVQMPTNVDGAPALATMVLHGASGESLTYTLPLVLAKQDMQGLGAALTYARRYAWAAALGICDESDDDGNRASAQVSSSGAHSPASDREARTGSPSSPPGSPPTAWRWPSGKHQGATLAETPQGYIEWYRDNGPKADIKAMCAQFLTEGEIEEQLVASGATPVADEWDGSDVPF